MNLFDNSIIYIGQKEVFKFFIGLVSFFCIFITKIGNLCMEDSIYEKKGCIKENHRENERVIEDIF